MSHIIVGVLGKTLMGPIGSLLIKKPVYYPVQCLFGNILSIYLLGSAREASTKNKSLSLEDNLTITLEIKANKLLNDGKQHPLQKFII